jgi:hypothetical protein
MQTLDMDEFFDKYADVTAFTIALVLPLLLTLYLKAKAKARIRAVAAYFLFFGPASILSFIFFHLFENTYRAIAAAIDRHFAYNFHFYSLILFGLVVAYIGALYLKASMEKCQLGSESNRSYFFKLLLMLTITVPLIPVTPIAAVPAICCTISVISFPFVTRKNKRAAVKKQEAKNHHRLDQVQMAKVTP